MVTHGLHPRVLQCYMYVTMPGGCTGTVLHPITIFPSPDVNQLGNQILCNGAATTDINFQRPGRIIVFTDVNDTAIGLFASGTGDILSLPPQQW